MGLREEQRYFPKQNIKEFKMCIRDSGYSGPALELLDKFGLTQPHLAKVVRDVVKEDK